MQGGIELEKDVGGRDVHIGDRFGRNNHPLGRRRGFGDGPQNMPAEYFRIGKKQRRIPAENHQAVNAFCLGVAGNIVITVQMPHMAEHGVIRLPRTPDERQQGQADRDEDARNNTQRHHTEKTHQR